MNALNRVLVLLLLLVAIPLCTILLVWPMPVLDALGGQLAALVEFVDSLQPFVRVLLGVLFALVLDVIFVLLIILQVRRPAQDAIRVEKTAGGEVLISVASIADRLQYEIDQLPDVLRSESRVSGKRGGVVVEMGVETATGINVAEKAGQIVETARKAVEEKMGLKLTRPPRVKLRVVPYPSTPGTPVTPGEPIRPSEPSILEEGLLIAPEEEGLPAEPEEGLFAAPED